MNSLQDHCLVDGTLKFNKSGRMIFFFTSKCKSLREWSFLPGTPLEIVHVGSGLGHWVHD